MRLEANLNQNVAKLRTLAGQTRLHAGRTRRRAARAWRFAGRYTHDRRANGAHSLVLVLAGHKRQLWPLTLQRVVEQVPAGHDVCVVTPGMIVPELREFAANHRWSYIATENGHVSLAQNLAIRAHPAAQAIHKLDEDMFISTGYFERLEAGYRRVTEESEFSIGLCSPLINVNAYSYADFLEVLELREDWERQFGPVRRATWDTPAYSDGDAAVWLWSNAIPVDEVAARFAARPFSYSVVPHRFSIGAILFKRSLWQEMGGFRRGFDSPGLGEDEEQIAMHTTDRGKVVAVVENVYAGHFAYGPQMQAMLAAFGSSLETF